jgi:hypothetical protein
MILCCRKAASTASSLADRRATEAAVLKYARMTVMSFFMFDSITYLPGWVKKNNLL